MPSGPPRLRGQRSASVRCGGVQLRGLLWSGLDYCRPLLGLCGYNRRAPTCSPGCRRMLSHANLRAPKTTQTEGPYKPFFLDVLGLRTGSRIVMFVWPLSSYIWSYSVFVAIGSCSFQLEQTHLGGLSVLEETRKRLILKGILHKCVYPLQSPTELSCIHVAVYLPFYLHMCICLSTSTCIYIYIHILLARYLEFLSFGGRRSSKLWYRLPSASLASRGIRRPLLTARRRPGPTSRMATAGRSKPGLAARSRWSLDCDLGEPFLMLMLGPILNSLTQDPQG